MQNIHGKIAASLWRNLTAGLLTAVFVLQPFTALASESEILQEAPLVESESEPVEIVEPVEISPSEPVTGKETPEPTEIEKLPGGGGGVAALSSGEGLTYYPGFKSDTSFKNQTTYPKVDESSGALTFDVPVRIPEGRNGMQPDLRLQYTSQDRMPNENMIGLGWSLSIPYIERIATSGTQNLYTYYAFRSTLSGELVQTASSSYAARTERGDFLDYQFDGTSWTVTAKNGLEYTFGNVSTSRVFPTATSTNIFRWMLTEMRDLDGNYVTYNYEKDEEQVYPETITYTNHADVSGIYTIDFDNESRPIDGYSYRPGFLLKTRKRLSVIKVLVSGTERYRMSLAYNGGDNGVNSLLTSTTERGTDAQGATYTLPPMQFNYDRRVDNATPINLPTAATGDGFQVAEINGDGLPDLVKSQLNLNVTTGQITSERKVYINVNNSSYTVSSTWNIPSGFELTYSWTGGDIGTRLVDMNGDGLADFLSLSKGLWYNSYNNGTSTWVDSGIAVPTSFSDTPPAGGGKEPSGAFLVDLNNDGLTDILRKEIAHIFNGTAFVTTTQWNLPMNLFNWHQQRDMRQTQFTDLNGDRLPDVVWMSATRAMHDDVHATMGTFTFATPTHRFFINTGVNFVESANSSTFQGFAGGGQFYKTSYIYPNLNVRLNSARFTDVNGDGLQDYVMHLTDAVISLSCGRQLSSETPQKRVYLNTGNGFVTSSNITAELHTLDMVLVPGGGCQVRNNFYLDRGAYVADFTGDTITDAANLVPGQYAQAWPSWSTDTLSRITYSEGGKVTVTYMGSGQELSGSNLLNIKLPMIQKVVKSIERDDVHGSKYTTKYTYEGGHLYRDAARLRDTAFAGFGSVKATSPSEIRTTHFHQGNATNTVMGETADSYARMGLPYKTIVSTSTGAIYSMEVVQYAETDLPEAPGQPSRVYVRPSSTAILVYDGGSTHKDTAETFVYDSVGNITEHRQYGEVTATTTGAFTDIAGDDRYTKYEYALLSGGATSTLVSRKTEMGFGAPTRLTTMIYDGQSFGSAAYGHPTNITTSDASSTISIAVSSTYDGLGLLLARTDARGNTYRMDYEANKLFVATTTNPLNQTVSSTYDFAIGQPTAIRDLNGHIQRMVYDPIGRQKEFYGRDPSGSEILLWDKVYTDSAGNTSVLKTTHFDGSNQDLEYIYVDGFGRFIESRKFAGSLYIVNNTGYDDRGSEAYTVVPSFDSGSSKVGPIQNTAYRVQKIYDPSGRLIKVITALGTTQHAYSLWSETVTDVLGKTKTFTYDAYGRLKTVVERNGPTNYTTTYTYNHYGNLLSITDANGNIRTFGYDPLGRRTTAQDLHASGDSSYLSISYAYDPNGNITGEFRSDSSSVGFVYDALDRPITVSHNSSTAYTLGYDSCANGVGKLCQESSSTYLREYAYDPSGDTRSQSLDYAGSSYLETFAHDRQGRVTSSTAPDGMSLQYVYQGWRFIGLNAKEATTGSRSIITNVVYEATQVPKETYYANGTKTTATYDILKLYRLTNLKTQLSGGLTVQDINYTYDNLNRITGLVQQATTATQRTVTYQYDGLDRLTYALATGPNAETFYREAYMYDGLGNILAVSSTDLFGTKTTSTYSYSAVGNANPHAVTAVSTTVNGVVGGGQTFFYDTRGNVTEIRKFNTSNTEILADRKVNTYDIANRMSTSTVGTVTSTGYLYDKAGMRLTQGDTSSTMLYVSPAYNATLNSIGTVIDTEKHIGDGIRTYATIDGTGIPARVLFSHPDHLSGGSIITNSLNQVEQFLDYTPYGSVYLDQRVGSWSEQRQFTGHEYDSGTRYNYMKARYYEPGVRRFLGVDPVFWDFEEPHEDPQLWNSYSYSKNSPIAHVDPDGREPISVAVGAAFFWTAAASLSVQIPLWWNGTTAATHQDSQQYFNAQQVVGWGSLAAFEAQTPALFIGAGGVVMGTTKNAETNRKTVGAEQAPRTAPVDQGRALDSRRIFTPKQKQEILQINIEKNQGQPRCANCSRPVTPGQKNLPGVAIPKDRIEYDHIKPYTKGGPTVVENGQVLCRACNLTKGSSDLMNKEKP